MYSSKSCTVCPPATYIRSSYVIHQSVIPKCSCVHIFILFGIKTHNMAKIGFIIPTTSHKRDWETWRCSLLYPTLASCLTHLTKKERTNHTIVFYIGHDHDDPFYTQDVQQKFLQWVKKHDIQLQFHKFPQDTRKGFCTRMWNILFQHALRDKCEYVYQCGDDIEWKTMGWLTDCIRTLASHDNVGVTGPLNNNGRILTQTFVHATTHFNIFGVYFSEQFLNWCCDDWINYVYSPSFLYPLRQHYCANIGGTPRYDIAGDPHFCASQAVYTRKLTDLRNKCQRVADKDRRKIQLYLDKCTP